MTPDQLRQALLLLALVLRPIVKKTGTDVDDIGLEAVEALANSPAMLDFICKRALGNPQTVQQLIDRMVQEPVAAVPKPAYVAR